MRDRTVALTKLLKTRASRQAELVERLKVLWSNPTERLSTVIAAEPSLLAALKGAVLKVDGGKIATVLCFKYFLY